MVLGLLGLRLVQLPIITSITIHYVLMMVARIIDLPIVMFMAIVRLYHHQYHTVAACGHGSIIVILLLYFYLFDCGYRPIWSFPCCKQKTGSLIIRPPLFVVSNHIPVCGMVDSWIASRLKLPRSEVGWWCPDWAVEFSHGPLTQVVKYICPSPTVCACHYRGSRILTDLTVVSMSVLLVVLACRVDSCHSLVRDGVRSLSLTHGHCPNYIADRCLLKISLDQWTRAVDLIGLRVVALGSSEVLLSDLWMLLIFWWNLSSVAWDWRQVAVHGIADSYLLKMTPELWSGLTSVVCLQTFVLAKCFDFLADGGGVLPTPECWNPNPNGMVCVYRWTALWRMLWTGSCHSLSAMLWITSDFSFCLGLESWVRSCLPAHLVHHL